MSIFADISQTLAIKETRTKYQMKNQEFWIKRSSRQKERKGLITRDVSSDHTKIRYVHNEDNKGLFQKIKFKTTQTHVGIKKLIIQVPCGNSEMQYLFVSISDFEGSFCQTATGNYPSWSAHTISTTASPGTVAFQLQPPRAAQAVPISDLVFMQLAISFCLPAPLILNRKSEIKIASCAPRPESRGRHFVFNTSLSALHLYLAEDKDGTTSCIFRF